MRIIFFLLRVILLLIFIHYSVSESLVTKNLLPDLQADCEVIFWKRIGVLTVNAKLVFD